MAKIDINQEKRERFLKNLIQEAVLNVLAEQEEEARSPVPPSPVAPAPLTNQPSQQEPQQQNQPPSSQQPEEEEEFNVDNLVDKLNVLRGGRSFTDPEVYGKLTTFFKGLTEEQKNSLNYLLTEMGKIVIGATEEEAGMEHTQKVQQPSRQVQPAPPPPTAQAPATQSASAPNAPISAI